jgi:hypothetical protein
VCPAGQHPTAPFFHTGNPACVLFLNLVKRERRCEEGMGRREVRGKGKGVRGKKKKLVEV